MPQHLAQHDKPFGHHRLVVGECEPINTGLQAGYIECGGIFTGNSVYGLRQYQLPFGIGNPEMSGRGGTGQEPHLQDGKGGGIKKEDRKNTFKWSNKGNPFNISNKNLN